MREGRKQGRELEWATVPVLRHRLLNFKHRLLFSCYLVGQKWENWAFRASINHFPPITDIKFTLLLFVAYRERVCSVRTVCFNRKRPWIMNQIKMLRAYLFCSICRFPVPVNFWDGGFLSRLREQRWRRNLSGYKLRRVKLLSKYPAPGFLSSCSYPVVVVLLICCLGPWVLLFSSEADMKDLVNSCCQNTFFMIWGNLSRYILLLSSLMTCSSSHPGFGAGETYFE